MCVAGLTLLIDVRLNVPVGVRVPGVVLLRAGDLDLSETPLRKVDISCPKITAHNRVLQAEGRRKRSDPAVVP